MLLLKCMQPTSELDFLNC